MKLTIEVTIGNDKMKTAQEVHHALMSSSLMQSEMRSDPLLPSQGIIKDINGNKVGFWMVSE